MYKDATPLVNPCTATADLEPPFRIVATSGAIIFEVLSLVGLVVLSLALPSVLDGGGGGRSPGDAYSVLLYTHTALWGLMMLLDCYLRRQHSILYCTGYISFYQLTKRLRRATVYVVSAESFQDFVSADMDLVCSEELTDEAIVAQVNGAGFLDDELEEEDEEDIAEPKVSAVEADEHLRALQRYCQQQEGLQDEVFYLQKLGR
ncbi:hypothetical protein HPB48_011565 [Haemaphysalis longicornis]|uniref:Transmembrane protein 192 n=1 Tax=Haemaphysalis longicornis TaxID=44386 RepID=A0A9J6FYU8_HAELO|nr:hypothetical protein HPB48_011565 [Haemaphysalis longicornis]